MKRAEYGAFLCLLHYRSLDWIFSTLRYCYWNTCILFWTMTVHKKHGKWEMIFKKRALYFTYMKKCWDLRKNVLKFWPWEYILWLSLMLLFEESRLSCTESLVQLVELKFSYTQNLWPWVINAFHCKAITFQLFSKLSCMPGSMHSHPTSGLHIYLFTQLNPDVALLLACSGVQCLPALLPGFNMARSFPARDKVEASHSISVKCWK